MEAVRATLSEQGSQEHAPTRVCVICVDACGYGGYQSYRQL